MPNASPSSPRNALQDAAEQVGKGLLRLTFLGQQNIHRAAEVGSGVGQRPVKVEESASSIPDGADQIYDLGIAAQRIVPGKGIVGHAGQFVRLQAGLLAPARQFRWLDESGEACARPGRKDLQQVFIQN